MKNRFFRFLRVPGILGISLLILVMSVPVEVPESTPKSIDVQVVLGGNTRERSAISHQLWREQSCPIVVTGDGGYTMAELLKFGIPEEKLIHEEQAQTTYENAVFSLPILKQLEAREVVIVTSDYHSARALSCFRKVAPEINFHLRKSPVEDRSAWDSFQLGFRERIKRIGYGLSYGISPWSQK